MRITSREPSRVTMESSAYRFEVAGEQAFIAFSSGHEFRLRIASTICRNGERDLHPGMGRPVVLKDSEGLSISIEASSSLWASKIYHFLLREDRIEYFVRVKGEGYLDRVLMLGTMPEPDLHPGIRWVDFVEEGIASKGNFQKVFLPQPTAKEQHLFSPGERIRHSADYHPEFHGGGHFFTPAPFCYSLEWDGKWLPVSLAVKPGEYRFPNFDYWGGEHFAFCLDYEGYWHIDAEWESPHLIFHAETFSDEYIALAHSVRFQYRQRWIEEPEKEISSWWRRPLFCGWGAQCHLHHQGDFEGKPGKDPAQSYATQSNYEYFIKSLESKGLDPGTVIIDDRWMVFWGHPFADPGKWRDLRGFIESQHARGRKVLLWFPAWERDGVPAEYCIRRGDHALKVDPTHPGYLKQLEEDIRRMLGHGPDDYNADGLKIDFTANIPSGPGCVLHEPIWGVELLYRLMFKFHEYSKQVKPDALLIAHTVHPRFASLIDMIRLNDMVVEQHSMIPELTHRARVAKTVHPSLLIDTDNWPCADLARWREYVREQPKLGVPSLYYATHVGRGEPMTDSDYDLLRMLWRDYEKGIAKQSKP